ncbi:MAG: hypothetical protein U0Y82_13205 [Thermoleophilia bacterium]
MSTGTDLRDLPDGVGVERTTRESHIEIRVGFGPRDSETPLDTGVQFFNHMLEMIAWHGGMNISATYRSTRFDLRHVVCEDIGIAFGRCVRRVLEARIPEGVACVGEAHGTIDEALAFAMFSLEGRANHHIHVPADMRSEMVEDVMGHDLVQFFEGFAQGSGGTVHLRLIAGIDPHHRWEAAFRAFARALRAALAADPWRAGATAGVKGTLE